VHTEAGKTTRLCGVQDKVSKQGYCVATILLPDSCRRVSRPVVDENEIAILSNITDTTTP
jgi:hypothetical protein